MPANPTQAAVEVAAECYRQAKCDGIVAVGGGSSMDRAKAVACDSVERGIRDGHLLAAVRVGGDRDVRWHMMMAVTEGAMAFSKGLGAVHAMSHACGADQT